MHIIIQYNYIYITPKILYIYYVHAFELSSWHLDDLPGVVVGYRGGPAGADAIGTIHQGHGDHRDVPLPLHTT